MSPPDRELARLTDNQHLAEEYQKRRLWELERAAHLGWSSALVEVATQVRKLREAGSIIGPARGSGEGCLLLWLLGVNTFDPVKFEIDPALFYRDDLAQPPVSYWASIELASHFFSHPALVGVKSDDVQPVSDKQGWKRQSWSYTHWPEPAQVLEWLPSRGLEDRAKAYCLGRPGPAGSGMLKAALSGRHDMRIYRDQPFGETRSVDPPSEWEPYLSYRGTALGEGLLTAIAERDEECLQAVGSNSLKLYQKNLSTTGVS